MAYVAGSKLWGEPASKTGHLEVLDNPLVKHLCRALRDVSLGPADVIAPRWEAVDTKMAEPLPLVFCADGSYQVVTGERPPYTARAFVKTALLRLDQRALAKVGRDSPHPFVMRDLLRESAIHHATVLPLRNVTLEGHCTLYEAVRHVVYRSLRDDSLLGSQPYETLKWLIYQKWDPSEHRCLPEFECPHCQRAKATLPFDADTGPCPCCGKELFVTDMLGLHLEMLNEDAAPDAVASSYMAIHETLMLLTAVRSMWHTDREGLCDCLFIKDGPLSFRAQYSKLVPPIRRFIEFAHNAGYPVHLIGQEKSGAFAEHLALIGPSASSPSVFIPDDRYIKERVQQRPARGAPYGLDTNYGAKVFLRLTVRHSCALNVATGAHCAAPTRDDLIGFARILATLPRLLSSRYEGGLLPVELTNALASLSTYPSAQVLRLSSVPVSTRINNVCNDDVMCLAALSSL